MTLYLSISSGHNVARTLTHHSVYWSETSVTGECMLKSSKQPVSAMIAKSMLLASNDEVLCAVTTSASIVSQSVASHRIASVSIA